MARVEGAAERDHLCLRELGITIKRRMVANRFIAYLDILGFQGLLKTRPLIEVAQITKALVADSRSMERSRYVGIADDGTYRSERFEFGLLHFSDCILVWSPPIADGDPSHREGLFTAFLLNLSSMIFRGLNSRIPLRAGVAFGELFVEPPVVVGTPLVDAWRLEEAQEWVGAAATESCGPPTAPLVTYPVPTKSDYPSSSSAVDWTLPGRIAARANGRTWDPEALLAPYIDDAKSPSVRKKYENSLAFARLQDTPLEPSL